MNQFTINIAYAAENERLANEIVRDLDPVNIAFNLIGEADLEKSESYLEKLTSDENPSILLISDNFLKSTQCMHNGLTYLQTLLKKEQVIPIIAQGRYQDKDGNWQEQETSFEKVSNVIKYMNFWQEKYLDLRKLKRDIPENEEEIFNKQLKKVRVISSEIGEFLRNLRDIDSYKMEEFQANHYELFFRIFGDEESYLKFVALQSESNEETEDLEIDTSSEEVVPLETLIQRGIDKDKNMEKNEEEAIIKLTEASEEPMKQIEEESEIKAELEETPIIQPEAIKTPSLFDVTEESDDKETALDDNETVKEEVVELSETTENEVVEPKIEGLIGEPTEIIKLGKEDIDKIISMDPEWEQINEEEALDEEDIEVEEESTATLEEIAESEERALTETELLALELAKKLPQDQEEETVSEQKEEVLSLEDLMGKDLMESVELDESNKEESEETKVLELFDAEETEKIDKRVSQLLEEDEEESEEDEEELEGYFVDEEEEEAEEEDDELDEYDVLQSSNILVQSGNISEGIDLLKAVLEEAPEFVSVRYQYAAFLAQYQNDFREASNQLAILLEEDPNNLSAKFFLGELAEAQRDYLTAKSYFEKVYEQNPNFPNIAYKLGLLLINPLKESPEKAAKYLKEAYEQNPNNINALYQLGGLQSEISKEPDQAIASFTEVLEKAPEHPFANYDLALIYYDKQDWEKALSYYEKACLINPELKTDENDQAFALEEIEEDISLEALSAEIGQKVEQQLNETIETKNPIASEVFVADRPPVVKNGAVYGEKKIEETQEEGVEEKISAMPQVPKQEKGIQKTVLITGSTSGIGRATAEAFAKNGYRLILTGRRFSRLFIMKEQFEESYGTDIRLLPFDIRSSQAIQSAIIELEEEWQDIDILINNAGLAKGSTTIQGGKLEDWENMIDTNLKGLLYITRAILPSMIKRKQGQIINVCSLAGHEVYANSGVYCATKHAVDALTKAMRLDLHQHRIRVSQVSPGFVEGTEFALVRHNGNEAAVENLFEDFTPANTADVANAIYFIASQPPHLNIQEITLAGTQQASASVIDRSGRFEG